MGRRDPMQLYCNFILLNVFLIVRKSRKGIDKVSDIVPIKNSQAFQLNEDETMLRMGNKQSSNLKRELNLK